jgi:DNA-binding response OmpR family regulator
MKRTTVFIIEKEASIANLIRYHLLSQRVKHVQVFPTPAECLYFMHKKSIPDFLIADLTQPEINAYGLLNAVKQSFHGVKILFLSPFTDDLLVKKLMENGATDYIFKSGRTEDWIHELLKNIEFLIRENIRAN